MLPTRGIATEALKNGYTVVVGSIDEAADISDRLAVEHLEIHVAKCETSTPTTHPYDNLRAHQPPRPANLHAHQPSTPTRHWPQH